jgi:hypothetical protein
MTGTTGMIWPSPRLRTLIDESVRTGTARVPACVALSSPGGGLSVNLGSQRIEEAVVSLLAMRSVERGSSKAGGAVAGADCAVLVEESRSSESVRVVEYGVAVVLVAIDVVVPVSGCGGAMSPSGAKPWESRRLPQASNVSGLSSASPLQLSSKYRILTYDFVFLLCILSS